MTLNRLFRSKIAVLLNQSSRRYEFGHWIRIQIWTWAKKFQIWLKMLENDWIFDWFWHFWLNSTISNLLIKKWLKKDQNRSTLIKIRSKLYQNHDCWSILWLKSDRTEIDDRIRPARNPNRCRFHSRGLIPLAYIKHIERFSDPFSVS